jgi:hypothetical protein
MAKLTDRTVRTALPGRHGDDAVRGLMLVVQAGGSRSWVLRYQMAGRRRDMGLGPYPEIGLARAREKAMEARRLAKDGRDPLAERRPRPGAHLRGGGRGADREQAPGLAQRQARAQWGSTLAAYAYPALGALDVKAVDTQAVLGVLRPIWTEKPETASRVRQRVEAVLDYAAATAPAPARTRRAGAATSTTCSPSRAR